jgi:ribosomal protein L11 methyltransferase
MYALTLRVPPAARALFLDALEAAAVAVAADEIEGGAAWRVVAYYEDAPEEAGVQAAIAGAAAAAGIAAPPASVEALPDKDWLAENRRDFPELRLARYHIRRAHHAPPPADGRVALKLEASLAFGSGTHASTQGCLLALDRLARGLRPRRILDLGCGSGILAVAAAKTWPVPVTASDIDANAIRLTRENARANAVAAAIRTGLGPGLRPVARRGRFDLILANILAKPLGAMAPALRAHLAPGGTAVLSGLLASDESYALARYRAQGLALRHRVPMGEWVTLVVRA